jgi:general secretion pathway protein A
VGWNANPKFDQRVFTELFEASGGVPRRINQICNRLMMLGAVDQRSRIDGVMLSSVLEELELDGTLQLNRPAPRSEISVPPVAAFGLAAAAAPTETVALAQLQTMLAERDALIAELQEAVIELANEQETAPVAAPDPAQGAAMAALEARLSGFEAKMFEQERTIRHTLTMLIEWIEADDASRAAA